MSHLRGCLASRGGKGVVSGWVVLIEGGRVQWQSPRLVESGGPFIHHRSKLSGVVSSSWRSADKSRERRAEPQWIVTKSYSATYSTRFRIQVVCKGSIGRGKGLVIAHGSRVDYPRSWLSPAGRGALLPDRILLRDLEAFSYNPAHGSFAASPFPAAAVPMVRIGGSSRTEPNYRWRTNSSRVKLTCLTTQHTP